MSCFIFRRKSKQSASNQISVVPPPNRPHKIIIIGDSSVGKTSLLNRYVDNTFDTGYMSTIGVDFKIKTVNIDGTDIKLQIWDTAGQERFRTITSTYYRSAECIMIVYDVTEPQSFLNVKKWIEEAKQYADSEVVKILVGTKDEDPNTKAVPTQDGKKLADSFGCMFIETSAKEARNVEDAFRLLAQQLHRKSLAGSTHNEGRGKRAEEKSSRKYLP